jgi:hypothetical protein
VRKDEDTDLEDPDAMDTGCDMKAYSSAPSVSSSGEKVNEVTLPCLVSEYKHGLTEEEMVSVVIHFPGGTKPDLMQVVLSTDRTAVDVYYFAPAAFYDMTILFSQEMNAGLANVDPRIIATKASLYKMRKGMGDAPKFHFCVSLPFPVLTPVSDEWKKGFLHEGAMILKLNLMAQQKAYTIKKENTSATFEHIDK